MALIKTIRAYEVIDSKGFPALEARLELDTGETVISSVPATHPVYPNEPVDVCDEDPERFLGQGMLRAASYINDLVAPKLVGISPEKGYEIDQWILKADGTKTKSRLGVNTLLTISQLITKAGAVSQKKPVYSYINSLYAKQCNEEIQITKIPTPVFNMINGGRHANTQLDFQEFQIIPSSSLTFGEAYQKGVELFYELKKVLEYRNATTSVGEEGGFSPNLSANLDALEILNETVTQRKLRVGVDVFLGIDMAASFFFKSGQYVIKDKARSLKTDEYLAFLKYLTENYSLLVLEDPLNTEDWVGWKKLTSSISSTIYVVGDELIRMSNERITTAVKEEACTSFVIKPNQAGTVSEILETIRLARQNKLSYIVAARTSETTDDFIADLAVATQAEFVKFGAPTRGERVSKYNRLWQIERDDLKIK